MNNSGGSDGVPRNFSDSFHPSGSYQTPLFSSQANHGSHQRLESHRINYSPRYSTSVPADQNRTINPTASQATVYQTPPLGHSSHFSPHASLGDSIDEFPLPLPQRAQPHIIPQQIPPCYLHNQVSSIIAPHTTYGFQGRYEMASYGPPIPPPHPHMQASNTGTPATFNFSGCYNTLSHGSPIPHQYPYAQASTTIGTSLPCDILGSRDTVTHGPQMSSHYLYTQAYPTTAAPHNIQGQHNTEVSRGSLGQYNTQSVRSFQPVQPVQPVQGSPGDPMNPTQALHIAPLPLQSGDTDASPKSTKRVRNHPCPASGCPTFRRLQDLRRHLSTHLPHWVNCPDPDCSWRGDRLSVFRKHWDSNRHPSSGQDLDEDQFIIYDPWPFVEKIEEGSLSIKDAQKQAMAMVSKRASELRKPELRENPWGRKRRRKPQKLG